MRSAQAMTDFKPRDNCSNVDREQLLVSNPDADTCHKFYYLVLSTIKHSSNIKKTFKYSQDNFHSPETLS